MRITVADKSYRKCLDGPLKGAVFNLPQGGTTGFIHRREGTGRYLPVGAEGLQFEYWRRCTEEEVNEKNKVSIAGRPL